MRRYQQYFTPADLSHELVSAIPEPTSSIADFTAGKGALIAAAVARWPNADFYALEIDPGLKKALDNELPARKSVTGSAYSHTDLFKLDLAPESLNLVIGNPPFETKVLDDYARDLMRPFLSSQSRKRKSIRAEALYLALANFYLKPDGYISIILPTGFIYGESHKLFWTAYLRYFVIVSVKHHDEPLFKNTKVRTTSLVLKKRALSHRTNEEVFTQIAGSTRDNNAKKHHTLEDCAPEIIKRGRASSAEGRRGMALHTTHLTNLPSKIDLDQLFPKNRRALPREVWCRPGDIVVSRVGTRCIGRLGLITSGTAPVTDCLFIIRLESNGASISQRHLDLFNSLCRSDVPLQALRMNTGSCAAHLTKKRLLSIQLIPSDSTSTA